MVDQRGQTGGVDRPHIGWWIAILGGMTVLGILAYHPGAYRWWHANVTTLLSQGLLRFVFIAAWLAHLGEGLYALRLAQRSGRNAAGWFVQTFLLGYASLGLLRARIAAAGPH